MCRKIFITLSVVVFLLGITKLSFAQTHTEHEQGITGGSKQAVTEEVVNVGNKICPISGEKIDEKLKATYEYEGKIYNFCCTTCVDDFKKDPQKYIKKVEQELQAESKEQATHEGHEVEMTQGPETIHQGRHH